MKETECKHRNGLLQDFRAVSAERRIVNGRVYTDAGDEPCSRLYVKFTCEDCGGSFKFKPNGIPEWVRDLMNAKYDPDDYAFSNPPIKDFGNFPFTREDSPL